MPKNLSKEEEQYLLKFGSNLRRLRDNRGMTQADLVYEAGVHGNMVGRIERGERAANILQLEKIARALELEISELFEFVE
ncbi:helix-turn-helix domain-containing protein [Flagellimonas flava]|uniref:helix-turn-helix domain-containing protein n=1 Tax=Flagellimonas flava TaxID=570519 RepID=UPI003D653103